MISIFGKDILSSVLVKVVLLILIAMWTKWIWDRRKIYALSYKLPGPVALPLIGNLIQLGCFTDHRRMIQRLMKMKEEYGSFLRVWFGPMLTISITDADDFKNVLTSKATYNKGFSYDLLRYTMDGGILVMSGDVWKKHRQIINPAFAISTIRMYQSKHNFYAVKMVDSLKKFINKGLVDLSIFAQRYSTDTICDSLYEMKFNFYKGDLDKYLNAMISIESIVHERICTIWMHSDKLFEISELNKRYKKDLNICRSLFDTFINDYVNKYIEDAKRNKKDAKKMSFTENLDGDFVLKSNEDVKSRSVINILAEAHMAGDMTMKEVIAEFHNIFFPGMDTMYTQISAAILLMGMHKHVQDKLWAEIKDFYFHDMDAEVMTEHFKHLPYLDMVMKETVRHFATAPMQIRYINEDFYLKSRDLVIPAGSHLVLMNILLHIDEKYWKKPSAFDPERFSPEETAKRPAFSYVPFSAGYRNCIGQVFATDSIKTALIYLIRNFEFSADSSLTLENLPTEADISLRSAVGYKLIIIPRQRTK